ncbi:hypothetical protein [Streptomyces sp. NPDC086766]|uniref:hypothetical protein n=1 Tax=Streptomyces sp. NPDC086766 TaxID=3365754 RepID=UPI0037F2014D
MTAATTNGTAASNPAETIGTSVHTSLAMMLLNMRGRVGVKGWLKYGLVAKARSPAAECQGSLL